MMHMTLACWIFQKYLLFRPKFGLEFTHKKKRLKWPQNNNNNNNSGWVTDDTYDISILDLSEVSFKRGVGGGSILGQNLAWNLLTKTIKLCNNGWVTRMMLDLSEIFFFF